MKRAQMPAGGAAGAARGSRPAGTATAAAAPAAAMSLRGRPGASFTVCSGLLSTG